MRIIDLSIKNISNKKNSITSLNDAIDKFNFIILLGSPGSGKSSLLEKYQSDNSENSQKISVKKFIKLNKKIDDSISILLLDGLDEYRTTEIDKSFIIEEIADKISSLKNERKDLQIVISCREMDWYGESDKTALREELKQEVEVFNILPLNFHQQNEMAINLSIENRDDFLDKFSFKGFLDNPQMFKMIADIWESDKGDISSKVEIYRKFFLNAREQNETHKNINKTIEIDDLFRVTGYLAFFYIFSSIDSFNDDFIDEIASSKDGYSLEVIQQILTTKLFSHNKFIHRTIAEFALANFIVNYKLDEKSNSVKERIKSLFIKKNKIPTELRGTYAWICSLSSDQEFISFDPYYQAIHGDNSLFQIEDKKNIIKAVFEYSKNNPYFYEFGQKMELEGFYSEELDELLIDEFKKALSLKNHYVYFISNIISQSQNISEKIKSFCKKIIEDNTIPSYYKVDFILALKDESEYLKLTLDKIKSNQILDDNDNLKENILQKLYPKYIDHTLVAEYLMIYKSEVIGYCDYLYDTKYENKFELIDNIYKLSFDPSRESKLLLPKNIESFIEDYFLETILRFEDSLISKEIYDILIHFKKYDDWYNHISFKSYRYEITDKEKISDKKMQKLTNELFDYFIDDVLINNDDELYSIYSFDYLFNYKKPDNEYDVYFSKISQKNTTKINLELFHALLNTLKRGDKNIPIINKEIQQLAVTYNLNEELEKRLNPIEQEWEKRTRERKEKKLKEEIESKKKNEEYFNSLSDDEIQKNFNVLNWVTDHIYITGKKSIDKFSEPKTKDRLINILKNAIYSDYVADKELLTIESLVENSLSARRNIDTLYYVSLSLNSGENIVISDLNFKKYLYMNALHHSYTGNIIKSDFLEKIEKKEPQFVINLLKDYIKLLISSKFNGLLPFIQKFIEQENNIMNLKVIAKSHNTNSSDIKNSLLENLLGIYGVYLSIEDLGLIINLDDISNDNKNTINALILFNNNDLENFNVNMAIALHSLIRDGYTGDIYHKFKSFDRNLKIKIIHYMMYVFNSEESIKHENGFQSSKDNCAEFLRNYAFSLLEVDEIKELYTYHSNNNDIWKNIILNTLNEKDRKEVDNLHGEYKVEEIKKFILNNTILSKEDFFTEVVLRIEDLKKKIEDSRDNDKLSFYNTSETPQKPKSEDECRDIIVQRLKDEMGDILEITREKYEGNNRVDFNIKYKKEHSFEVQIECKKDDHKELYNAIENQLIKKYFASSVQCGIYLVFYFGKKDKDLMLKEINQSIPSMYIENVKIVCIDLT